MRIDDDIYDNDTSFYLALLVALFVHMFIIYGIQFVPPAPEAPLIPDQKVIDITITQPSIGEAGESELYAEKDLSGISSDTLEMHQTRINQSERTPKPRPADFNAADPIKQFTLEKTTQLFETLPMDAEDDTLVEAKHRSVTRDKQMVIAATQQHPKALYVANWRRKIEAYGKRFFPKAALDRGLQGEVTLTVDIHEDGSIKEIHVDQSSGSHVLDEGAIDIVKKAAPFAPFPSQLAKNTHDLSITRVWKFEQTG